MDSAHIYTLGHSTRTIEDFLALVAAFTLERIVDVRTVPQSRRNPQFAQQQLERSLAEAGIDYRHMKALGGLRKPAAHSLNTGWRNASFRAYADHMQTAEFAVAIEALVALASDRRTAVMCAEAVPWRCHRSLIGDALLVRGVAVVDIMSATQSRSHELTSFAHVEGTSITYPPPQSELPL